MTDALLLHRLDPIGVITRQRRQLDVLEEALLGDLDDPAEWWRTLADRYDDIDSVAAGRFRKIATTIEEARLA